MGCRHMVSGVPAGNLAPEPSAPVTLPGFDFDFEQFRGDLEDLGLDPDWIGERPLDIIDQFDDGDQLWRYQAMRQYWYGEPPSGPGDQGSPVAPIQFRIVLYTVNEPSHGLTYLHINDVQIDRVATMFDTAGEADYRSDETYEGYLSGFDPYSIEDHPDLPDPLDIESKEVPAASVPVLGVPMWFAEVYDEDRELRGYANGFFDPFRVRELREGKPAPQHEKFRIGKHKQSRDAYEILPRDAARERLKGTSKKAFVNGLPVGQVNSARGYVEVKRAYSERYGLTYRGDYSREGLIEEGGMHPNEFVAHKSIYKTAETRDSIHFVTSKKRLPGDWSPVSETDVDIDAIGEIEEQWLDTVDDDEQTPFLVVNDVNTGHGGKALGKYAPPTWRHVVEETIFP